MNEISIIKAGIADLEIIRNISIRTFVETFASANSPENIEIYLAQNFNGEQLRNELVEVESAFFIAWNDDEAVGYLKVNFGTSQTELKDPLAMEVERIYVLDAVQGRKIGFQLFQYAIALAKAARSEYLWLGVWEQNKKALDFYKKIGLNKFSNHKFILGNDVQTDLLLKLEL